MLHRTRYQWVIMILMLSVGNAMAVEEAKYSVLRQDNRAELRLYQSHIVAETIVDEAFEDAGSEAFGRLFKYISGHNQQRQSVAMTSPVGQHAASREIEMTAPVGQRQRDDKWAVSFMMPASFTLDTTPEPKDSSIVIRQIPERQLAAIRYSGFWSEKNYRENLNALQRWITEHGLRQVGEPLWARYNPPLTPWFLRRNEVLVPVETADLKE